jgi:hypothetical protein
MYLGETAHLCYLGGQNSLYWLSVDQILLLFLVSLCYDYICYKQFSTPGATNLAVLWDEFGVTDIAAGFRLHAGD